MRDTQAMNSLRTVLLVLCVSLSACATLPPHDSLPPASSPPLAHTPVTLDPATTRLGVALAPQLAAHPGLSGIYALAESNEAFAARALLAAAADKTLDVQYYIWHPDNTGYLLFESLWQAAERGVSVRLLFDDNNTAGLDDTLRALDAHPNIEVRLYNPMAMRTTRMLNFATDFSRLNRRMHNKSFTADNQASIVGGRNVGDEYFGASEHVGFEDLDVIAAGPAAKDVTSAFELYWNSASAYPAASVIGEGGSREDLLAHFAAAHADQGARDYLQALKDTRLVSNLLAGTQSLQWAHTQLVVDDPDKTSGKLDEQADGDRLMLGRLMNAIDKPANSFDLVTPYFVPGDQGTATLAALAQNKVRVRILTNSLSSSDVTAVHAGYANYRRALLKAGVELYELKPQPRPPSAGKPAAQPKAWGGSSSASLHAKTFAIDDKSIFVGSFNFDKRSAFLNTEMGLVIEDATLAGRLVRWFDEEMPARAYRVVLQPDGKLGWIEQTAQGEIRHDTEPDSSALQRGWVNFLSILPIEWLL
jgi:putative cardiolipin synthase